jgi:hypothetical protein
MAKQDVAKKHVVQSAEEMIAGPQQSNTNLGGSSFEKLN